MYESVFIHCFRVFGYPGETRALDRCSYITSQKTRTQFTFDLHVIGVQILISVP
jgi:hypothetical protein